MEDDGEGRDVSEVRLSGQQCRVRQAGEPPPALGKFSKKAVSLL